MRLHIDIETYSSIDLKSSGAYRYFLAPDFEVLLVAYAFDDRPVELVDLARGETLPREFIDALMDPNVEKHAHNANFERNAFRAIGYSVPIDQWHCTMVKAAYCGLPLSLEMVSEALDLQDKSKLKTGKALIRYFSQPCKPTKANGKRRRNLPEHDEEKWEQFREYCRQDVVAEREISTLLAKYEIPDFERQMYILDQEINDRGILIDLEFARKAIQLDQTSSELLEQRMVELTGVENPNSPAQLKEWLGTAMNKGQPVQSLAKDEIPALIDEAGPGAVSEVLRLRQKAAKTSIKKYQAMLNCASPEDHRGRGLLQYYGANRTGRWAGRLVQVQNLPRNYVSDLELARQLVKYEDYDTISLFYDDVPSILSQLIRTAFIAKPGHTFVVADFSAIEARVTAWLAGEQWRLDVFNSHGKIYEASASAMFGIPIEQITKNSPERKKGKIAELALGYGGSLGALTKMGGEDMGLSRTEMKGIVRRWREKNPAIVSLWEGLEHAAKVSLKTGRRVETDFRGVSFEYDGTILAMQLPSGRKLCYYEPSFGENRFGNRGLQYKEVNKGKWWHTDTYGGKLTENAVQAISRDLLAWSMLRLKERGFTIVMHVHDEVICEEPEEIAEQRLSEMNSVMASEIPWAPDMPNKAEGFITPFYKKD